MVCMIHTRCVLNCYSRVPQLPALRHYCQNESADDQVCNSVQLTFYQCIRRLIINQFSGPLEQSMQCVCLCVEN